MSEIQESLRVALRFAAEKHLEQQENGTDLPYLVHLETVAMEVFFAWQAEPVFDIGFALTLAYLHDTLEDTETTKDELIRKFGTAVADGVYALTKLEDITDKEERLLDSLQRIKSQPKEAWIVKMSDRVANLEALNLPWPEDKRRRYMEGSNLILDQLKDGHPYLAQRLRVKIKEYVDYVVTGK